MFFFFLSNLLLRRASVVPECEHSLFWTSELLVFIQAFESQVLFRGTVLSFHIAALWCRIVLRCCTTEEYISLGNP